MLQQYAKIIMILLGMEDEINRSIKEELAENFKKENKKNNNKNSEHKTI